MPTEPRQRARRERERGRRPPPAETPGEIPGQTSIWDALDQDDDNEEEPDGNRPAAV